MKKKKDAQAHKRNQYFLSCSINSLSDRINISSSNSNDSHDEFANWHSDSSDEKEPTTTHAIDEMDAHD